MQVDMNVNMTNKWSSAGRVPPLDLSAVTAVCGTRDTGKRQWSQLNGNASDHSFQHHHHHHHHQHDTDAASDDDSITQQRLPINHHRHNNHLHHLHHGYNHHQQQQHQQLSTNLDYPPINQRNPIEQMNEIDLVHGADGLPIDPRDWTRADVWSWLTNLALSEGLQPTSDLVLKFPMNGKALCLMSLDMYLVRVPHGGKMLYRDFRVRLARAMNL